MAGSLNDFLELDAFITHLKTEQGASIHTIEAYSRDILRYLVFLEEVAKSTLETVQFEDFLAHLRTGGMKTRSIARTVSAVRSFYKFLLADGKIKTNPIQEIETPRFQAPVPRSLSEEEMVKLLKLPASQKMALRDAAILELLYAAGLQGLGAHFPQKAGRQPGGGLPCSIGQTLERTDGTHRKLRA